MSSFLDIVRGSPIVIGTATKHSPSDTAYNAALNANFNALTHEWSLKWGPTETNKGKIDLNEDALSVLQTAKAGKKKVKGHALVWHQTGDLPKWYGGLTIDEKKTAIEWHVKKMVGQLKGTVYKWDVVNEAIDDATNSLRPFWQELGGIDMIEKCFRWANMADPAAILIYNDYCCTNVCPKADAIFKMVTQLKQSGCPIHEVGFQTHESIDCLNDAWFDSMKENMRRFKDVGVTVNISELDLHYDSLSPEVANARQAECYYKMLKTALSDLSICTEVTFWQFSSKYSWIYDFYKGTDKSFSPCPWDKNNLPTPAVDAIKTALREVIGGPPPQPQRKWSAQACSLAPAHIVSNRKYAWSGPIVQLETGKTARLQAWVQSKETLIVTLKHTLDGKNYTYANLLRTSSGQIDQTFEIPNATAAFVYVECAVPATSFAIGPPTITYAGKLKSEEWKAQECTLEAVTRVYQRINAWSGPIVGVSPNSKARICAQTWMPDGNRLLLTLKYKQQGKTVYTNLLSTNGGPIDKTFNIPQADSAHVYFEAANTATLGALGFEFVVSHPNIMIV